MTQEEIKSALEILADRKLPIPARLLWVYQWLGGWLADQERVDPKNLFEGERSFYRYSALLRAKSLPPVSVTTATRVSHDCHPCQSRLPPVSVEKVTRVAVNKKVKKHEGIDPNADLTDTGGTKGGPKSNLPRTQGCVTTSFSNKKNRQVMCAKKNNDIQEKHGQQKTEAAREGSILKWRTMAELLCRTVQDVEGLRYQKHLQKWERQFRALHADDGVPTSLIWKVLKWYCKQRAAKTDSKLPKCVTANMFRGAFGWIMERWEREGGSTPKPDQRWVDAAHQSFRDREFHRTSVTIESLSGLYGLINEWQESTIARLRSIKDLRELDFKFMFEVLNARSDGISLPEQLGHYLYHRIENWEDWGGDLSSFRPGGHEFTAFLQRRAKDVWGERLSPNRIDILLQGANATTEN